MNEGENFQRFYTEFTRLAGIGRIPKDNLVNDLYLILTPRLQDTALTVLITIRRFTDLSHHSLLMDQHLRRLQVERHRRSAACAAQSSITLTPFRAPIQVEHKSVSWNNKETPPTAHHYAAANSFKPPPRTPLVPTAFPTGEVKCYNCNKVSHYSKDCTEPRNAGVDEMEAELDEPTDVSASSGNYDIWTKSPI